MSILTMTKTKSKPQHIAVVPVWAQQSIIESYRVALKGGR